MRTRRWSPQAEIELAFHSPETVGSWHARWSDRVAEHDLETLFWQWGERFPSLAGMERWQWQDMPFWQVTLLTGSLWGISWGCAMLGYLLGAVRNGCR